MLFPCRDVQSYKHRCVFIHIGEVLPQPLQLIVGNKSLVVAAACVCRTGRRTGVDVEYVIQDDKVHLADVKGVIIRRDDFPERCRCLKVSTVGIRCRAVVVVVTHAGEERQAVAVVGQCTPEILQTVIL